MHCPQHFPSASHRDSRTCTAARIIRTAGAIVAVFCLCLALLMPQSAARADNPSFAFSPDGARIVTFDSNATVGTSGDRPTVSSDTSASLWDGRTGKRIAVLRGHIEALTSASFSPDGMRIVTASQDTTARLWDGRTGGLIASLQGHKYALTSAAFSPDGTRIATVSPSDNLRLWDGRTGKLTRKLPGIVSLAAFSPDSTRLLTAGADAVFLWDTVAAKLIAKLPGISEQATQARFSPDSTRIAIVTGGFTPARLWDGHTGTLTVKLGTATNADQRDMLNVASAVFSSDSARFAMAASGGTYLWDAHTGKLVAPIQTTIPMGGYPISVLLFSSDSTRLVTSNLDRSAAAWDTRTGKFIGALQPAAAAQGGSMDDQFTLTLSPDGTRLVTLDTTSSTLRDGVTGKLIASLSIPPHPTPEAAPTHPAVVFSPDSTRFLTTSNDANTVLLWDARTGKLLATLTGNRHAAAPPTQ